MKWLLVCALLAVAACGSGKKSEAVQAEAAKAKPAAAEHSATRVSLPIEVQQKSQVQTLPVASGNVAEALHATGRITLNENQTWHVGAITEGRVLKLAVNVGDRVAKDDVLARMHSHDVHEARALYQRSLSELGRAKTNENQARRVRDRAKRLYDLKAASLEQLEHAETELKNMQSAVFQAQVEVDRTKTHLIDFLGIKLEEPDHHEAGQHHDDDADLIPVKAPAGGIIIDRHVTTGTVVQPGGEMFTISDLKTLWMLAAVPEEHYARLRVGMTVRVSVQAHPGQAFRGKITRLGEQLDAATRTIQARIELPNATGLLKPEMYADAELELPGTRTAIYIPEHAIQEVKGNATVFVRRGPTEFEAVAVETGQSTNGKVEIRSGLSPGDEVVEKGAFVLKSQLLKSSLAEE